MSRRKRQPCPQNAQSSMNAESSLADEKLRLEVAKLQLEVQKLTHDDEKVQLESKSIRRWYTTPQGILAIVGVATLFASAITNTLDYKLSSIKTERMLLAKEQAEKDRKEIEADVAKLKIEKVVLAVESKRERTARELVALTMMYQRSAPQLSELLAVEAINSAGPNHRDFGRWFSHLGEERPGAVSLWDLR